jgi:hypothetical protein
MKRRAMTISFLGAAASALALGCADRDLGSVGQPDAGGSGGTISGSGGTSPGSGGANGSGGAAGDAGNPPDNGQCTNIARPSAAQLPHVDASGTQATDIVQALAALYAAQTPPLSPPATHVITSLFCSETSCSFTVKIGASPTEVKGDKPALAKALFDALKAAGAVPCGGDPKSSGSSIKAADMNVSANQVQFDDVSTYSHGWAPNVVAGGAAGQGLLSAFAFAAINDCDPSSSVFMICTNFAGHPQCGYQRRPYQKVGSSWFLNSCLGTGGMQPGDDLSNDQSFRMWQAILVAAQAAGFKSNDGPIEGTTVINAHFFTWDGSTARFFLLTGGATPPSMPP